MAVAVGGWPTVVAANAAMERYAQGDDAAFVELYDALAPRLFGFAFRQTRDRASAEDFVQQTLLQIHRMRGRFVAGSDVLPWAFAILRRLIIDGHRRGRKELLIETPPALSSEEAGADEVVHARRLAQRLEEAVARLPTSLRDAFELVKCEGLEAAQAGAVLGISANAVKIRVHRACEALKSELGDHPGAQP